MTAHQDLALRKRAARAEAALRRKEAHAADAGAGAGMLSSVLAGYRGVPLSGYMPIRSEIDPLPAMAEAAAHGPVAIPVIEAPGAPLRFARWEPDMALVPGAFGALVPEAAEFLTPEILIVPLLAFTRSGHRLGYGGGFYDRTLEALRAARPAYAIGFAYGAQEAGEIPLEPTDAPLDLIVTEREIITPAR
ncbi:5-formyltetrahydrofolate cyclo-ligase [Yangia mangrovi]|uniref:5-formyltetrahydrofolate cyclo-ligase n=2 Tax=Alloyangia mangrovi TaxID=1779329 RepID=A0ABT2KQG3_9RHOB|nr:5-formyltetrahydrofolate cyclo-ligase [Alloyangia mangrovi]MCA0939475.1 5-formyltetrahydrofolate cyclo-ligase [Alloyangia pacifica]MCA0943504.1 5-formyltetrahydrofolate cyclo-ligase [Alloyangia pacifica]MCT4371698.1 5-formyltetrahydrofolate cyclo-ligase [Alloyangia mangrovi]